MKKYQTLYDEVHSYLLRESINADVPMEQRAFINSMLIFIDTIITDHSDIFDEVYKEAFKMEEAKMN